MMDAEQVVAKILSEAKAEGEKIVSEARGKCDSQQARLAGRLTAYEKETQTLSARAAEDKNRRMLAAARMDIRKNVLARKVSLLDEVFENAKGQIQSLGDGDYGKLITSLMLKAVETGDEKVVIGKNERRIDDRLIKNINRQLDTGFKGIPLGPYQSQKITGEQKAKSTEYRSEKQFQNDRLFDCFLSLGIIFFTVPA